MNIRKKLSLVAFIAIFCGSLSAQSNIVYSTDFATEASTSSWTLNAVSWNSSNNGQLVFAKEGSYAVMPVLQTPGTTISINARYGDYIFLFTSPDGVTYSNQGLFTGNRGINTATKPLPANTRYVKLQANKGTVNDVFLISVSITNSQIQVQSQQPEAIASTPSTQTIPEVKPETTTTTPKAPEQPIKIDEEKNVSQGKMPIGDSFSTNAQSEHNNVQSEHRADGTFKNSCFSISEIGNDIIDSGWALGLCYTNTCNTVITVRVEYEMMYKKIKCDDGWSSKTEIQKLALLTNRVCNTFIGLSPYYFEGKQSKQFDCQSRYKLISVSVVTD